MSNEQLDASVKRIVALRRYPGVMAADFEAAIRTELLAAMQAGRERERRDTLADQPCRGEGRCANATRTVDKECAPCRALGEKLEERGPHALTVRGATEGQATNDAR